MITEVQCSSCDGEGQVYYDFPVVDYENGGWLEQRLDACEDCDGSGFIEVEIEDDE
tara:strand:- start:511 stop:678 length:168 start_codon:yes stop_codon:yes gene_type:complete